MRLHALAVRLHINVCALVWHMCLRRTACESDASNTCEIYMAGSKHASKRALACVDSAAAHQHVCPCLALVLCSGTCWERVWQPRPDLLIGKLLVPLAFLCP